MKIRVAFHFGLVAFLAFAIVSTSTAVMAGDMRNAVGHPLLIAKRMIAAGNCEGAAAQVRLADDVASKTATELAVIAQMRDYMSIKCGIGNAGLQAKVRFANDYNSGHYKQAISDADLLRKYGEYDAQSMQVVAQAYYLMHDYTNSERTAREAISTLDASGSPVPQGLHDLMVRARYMQGNIASAGPHRSGALLPEFYGVFAIHNGQLTELQRNPQSGRLYTALAGADVVQSLSNITFSDSNLTFIIFSPQVANLRATQVNVNILAPIRNVPPPAFHLFDRGWTFHIAPVPNQPQMVRLVSDRKMTGGHLALMFDNGFYDFEVASPPDPNYACVVRQVSIMGASYTPC